MAYFNNDSDFYSNSFAAEELGDIYPYLNMTPATEETGGQLPDPLAVRWEGFVQPNPMVGSSTNLPTPANHGKCNDWPLVD